MLSRHWSNISAQHLFEFSSNNVFLTPITCIETMRRKNRERKARRSKRSLSQSIKSAVEDNCLNWRNKIILNCRNENPFNVWNRFKNHLLSYCWDLWNVCLVLLFQNGKAGDRTNQRTILYSVTRLGDLLDFAQQKSFWQQLFCPNLPHYSAIFVKESKSLIFLVKSFLGNF